MASPTSAGVLQAATTIARTVETLVGTIDTSLGNYLTLFLNYTKGDETGLNVVPYLMSPETTQVAYQIVDLALSGAGLYAATAVKIQFTSTAKWAVTLDVRGVNSVKVYQGGSNNDGTPTGTLAASYILKQ